MANPFSNNYKSPEFDPFVEYSVNDTLTRDFVDYVISLTDTHLKKAYAIFRSITKSQKSIRVDWYQELDYLITQKYEERLQH